MSQPNIGHGLQNDEPVSAVQLTRAPRSRSVPTEAHVLSYKETCLLALAGQDAVGQTHHLSPVSFSECGTICQQ